MQDLADSRWSTDLVMALLPGVGPGLVETTDVRVSGGRCRCRTGRRLSVLCGGEPRRPHQRERWSERAGGVCA